MSRKVKKIEVQGLVQGVGFRPFIYRIACEMGLRGQVENHTHGVSIRLVANEAECSRFIHRIHHEHPPVASIHRIDVTDLPDAEATYTHFTIAPSRGESDEVTQVAPDIAVCNECLADRQQQPHRAGYPFINCTHCGPRFSIIKDLPYDRVQTTMKDFRMCPDCRREYADISDRRFHAQPIACNNCGPIYYTLYNKTEYRDYTDIVQLTARLVAEGEMLAVKGIGGYHLVCDATNQAAVARLRALKERDTKPFAVMFRDIECLKQYAEVNAPEEACLLSWRRPIVLLRQKQPLASGVNPGMQTLGCMLPYMPLHYDWFEALDAPALVMTSGNLSDVPIAITPEEAAQQFFGKVSLLLHHNREIHNRVDDSVMQVCGNEPCLIRRSRGYVPEPFFIDREVEGILAFGAEKVNTFSLGKGNTILQSQYIGDLKNWETYHFYTESLARFSRLFRFRPRQLVCDLHPNYLSSQEAARMAAEEHLPLLTVQHHHAHAAACMAEHGLTEPVIAIIMDGSGLGDDQTIWGGEFFLCNRKHYRRLAHLPYVPLPGGDKAAGEPWRMAVSYLHTYALPFPKGFTERVGDERIARIRQMITKQINSPLTSGAGRLFDAVASLLSICDVSTHQAEAPVLLEQEALTHKPHEAETPYPYIATGSELSLAPLLHEIVNDWNRGEAKQRIAYRFHLTLAALFVEKAIQLLTETKATKVIISGGCFQNRLLTELVQKGFARKNIPLYIPKRIPCNDAGISVGQLVIAAEN